MRAPFALLRGKKATRRRHHGLFQRLGDAASAAETLAELGVPHEVKVVSPTAPRPEFEYAASAEARGLEVIVAGAGGAAPCRAWLQHNRRCRVGSTGPEPGLNGMDSLLSIAQMRRVFRWARWPIGKAGAINAGLLAAAIVSNRRPELRAVLHAYRAARTQAVLEKPDPRG